VAGATPVIKAINKVSLNPPNLQRPARLFGVKLPTSDQDVEIAFAQETNQDIARGLNSVATTLTTTAPRIIFLLPFALERGTDTVIIALVEFVKIYQALLNSFIGQAGLIENGPIKCSEAFDGEVQVCERGENTFAGCVIATAFMRYRKDL
jgi:hypothetical protein